MPLMAHKDNGFHQAMSGEVEALQKAGWELCSDPMEYKRRVWGIGKQAEVVSVAESQAPAPSEPGDDGVVPIPEQPSPRRGRPRKAE